MDAFVYLDESRSGNSSVYLIPATPVWLSFPKHNKRNKQMQTQYINELLNIPELHVSRILFVDHNELHINATPVAHLQSNYKGGILLACNRQRMGTSPSNTDFKVEPKFSTEIFPAPPSTLPSTRCSSKERPSARFFQRSHSASKPTVLLASQPFRSLLLSLSALVALFALPALLSLPAAGRAPPAPAPPAQIKPTRAANQQRCQQKAAGERRHQQAT